MTNTQHTQGPWFWKNEPYPDGKPYCTIWAGRQHYEAGIGFDISGIISDADARIMAASPELLEALESCLWMIETFDGTNIENEALLDKARAAITKARGQS